jgi:hypothetical protein
VTPESQVYTVKAGFKCPISAFCNSKASKSHALDILPGRTAHKGVQTPQALVRGNNPFFRGLRLLPYVFATACLLCGCVHRAHR